MVWMPPKKSASKASAKPPKSTTTTNRVPSTRTPAKERPTKTSAAKSKGGDARTKTTTKAARAAPPKRKAEAVEEPIRETKKARVVEPRVTKQKPKVVINHAPTTRLNVYVCGEGSSGELGLGPERTAVDVKRPRLNPYLSADKVGVVQVAVGGMHCVALTHDNKILTWGVNDQGALGRDTTWDGGYKEVEDNKSDADSDSDDDPALNPYESTPTAIPSDTFPESTVFVEVAAGDSSSFALTDDGQVYGWGTFRNQLGRRIIERNRLNGLQPREFGLPKNIIHIGSGAFHSFAVHQSGKVYAWGLNSFGETGIQAGAGDDEAAIVHPTIVDSLSGKHISQVCGGAHHSIAVADGEQCLVWGRLDGFQTGLKVDTLAEEAVIKDERGRPRILIEPTPVPGIKASAVAAGSDHSIAIDTDGRPWSWGFSATYQTGQGTSDDIEVATIVENTAVRGKKLNWAGAGGQFSVFTEPVVV
ncbi:hypothetical protein APSETT445_008350 [Aspergillus pseudonomiae]